MLTERANLDAFRRGDRAVLTQVYQNYLPVVARLAQQGFSFSSAGKTLRFRGFTTHYERQDLIQETFVRAFGERARIGYDGLSPYEGYLTGIAKRIVIDGFREQGKKMAAFEVELHEVREPGNLSEDTPGDTLDREKITDVVREVLATLPLIERSFVGYRYEQRLTQKEVARRMRTRRSRVRTLEARVRRRLELALQQHGLLDATSGSPAALCALAMVL